LIGAVKDFLWDEPDGDDLELMGRDELEAIAAAGCVGGLAVAGLGSWSPDPPREAPPAVPATKTPLGLERAAGERAKRAARKARQAAYKAACAARHEAWRLPLPLREAIAALPPDRALTTYMAHLQATDTPYDPFWRHRQ
jgi:hypothetical protein